jgi:hypothetical protein
MELNSTVDRQAFSGHAGGHHVMSCLASLSLTDIATKPIRTYNVTEYTGFYCNARSNTMLYSVPVESVSKCHICRALLHSSSRKIAQLPVGEC